MSVILAILQVLIPLLLQVSGVVLILSVISSVLTITKTSVDMYCSESYRCLRVLIKVTIRPKTIRKTRQT